MWCVSPQSPDLRPKGPWLAPPAASRGRKRACANLPHCSAETALDTKTHGHSTSGSCEWKTFSLAAQHGACGRTSAQDCATHSAVADGRTSLGGAAGHAARRRTTFDAQHHLPVHRRQSRVHATRDCTPCASSRQSCEGHLRRDSIAHALAPEAHSSPRGRGRRSLLSHDLTVRAGLARPLCTKSLLAARTTLAARRVCLLASARRVAIRTD